jgi:hypothetical protein
MVVLPKWAKPLWLDMPIIRKMPSKIVIAAYFAHENVRAAKQRAASGREDGVKVA